MAAPSKQSRATLMGLRAHELAAAMSYGSRVSAQLHNGDPVEGKVTQRLLDPSLPFDASDPTSTQLVYVIGGVRVPIGQVRSVGVVAPA